MFFFSICFRVCVYVFLQFFSPFLTFFRFQYVQTWFPISIGPNAMASFICQCDTEQKPEMAESIPKDREKKIEIDDKIEDFTQSVYHSVFFSLC